MAKCTGSGCGIETKYIGDPDDPEPVETDGTYANDKYVCDSCYCKLIAKGQDIGDPEVLQERASRL